jgi:hypothetical protein
MPNTNDAASPPRAIEVFCAYSHRDESLRDELETHLSILKRRGMISVWHDRRISGGQEWNEEISDHLNRADLILLLVSADFLASAYCYEKEVARAMARHQLREARVVPVILRDCVWDLAPFSKLQALPKDGKPVAAWDSRDEALKDIALGIRRLTEELAQSIAKPWKERQDAVPAQPHLPVELHRHVSPVSSPRDLLLYGPRIKVKFGPPILSPPLSSDALAPSLRDRFFLTDALLDLGAGRTVLSPEAVRKAGLTKVDQASLTTVGGYLMADVYAASLQFPSGLSPIDMIPVVCCELANPLFYCLLGRDVLSRWVLNYDGPIGTWSIAEGASRAWVGPPEGTDPGHWRR